MRSRRSARPAWTPLLVTTSRPTTTSSTLPRVTAPTSSRSRRRPPSATRSRCTRAAPRLPGKTFIRLIRSGLLLPLASRCLEGSGPQTPLDHAPRLSALPLLSSSRKLWPRQRVARLVWMPPPLSSTSSLRDARPAWTTALEMPPPCSVAAAAAAAATAVVLGTPCATTPNLLPDVLLMLTTSINLPALFSTNKNASVLLVLLAAPTPRSSTRSLSPRCSGLTAPRSSSTPSTPPCATTSDTLLFPRRDESVPCLLDLFLY
mmetsp:Transcript_3382/g.9119  ORF Transcript_3382/g.9119 Transcript_3382/m.9119 type:complete len:261 (+) Transcript_3382:793-1575(+)